MYEENPIGVENITYKYYIQNMKSTGTELSNEEFEQAVKILVDTEKYIINFNVANEEYEGTDYNGKRYNPERIGKNLEEIDNVYDYDYELLDNYKKLYSNVDRKRSLAGIFYKVCGQTYSNIERHKAILEFCNKISIHSVFLQPSERDGSPVYDPIILLELHEMRCGHIARLGHDLFSAVGYKTRLVQFGGHIIAEIYYDEEWHYFDADLWNSDIVFEDNGVIPSVAELSLNPYLIDRLPNTVYESYLMEFSSISTVSNYPSWAYFDQETYITLPYYCYKNATEAQELNNLYGWNCYEIIEADIKLNAEKFQQPGIPYIKKIEVSENNVSIAWSQGENDKSDIIGYKVFISKESRGWEYANIYSEPCINSYIVNKYKPSQYDKIAELPASEVCYMDITATEIEIELDKGVYYVSVMPYDSHGESVGREIYLMSNELRIDVE